MEQMTTNLQASTGGTGRYAPTPSGDLHIGNLRTALVAWLAATSTGRAFVPRVDDLDPDRSRAHIVERQFADLAAIGVRWNPPVEATAAYRESDHLADYAAAVTGLQQRGLVYECFCTRREILEAPTAPHAPAGAYPGTCRDLTEAERAERRKARPHPALRLRSGVTTFRIHDAIHGSIDGAVDDLVLRRGDGAYAYNLAVVVDDANQGVDQVVRGDDLLSSAARQAYLAQLLGAPRVEYVHVPLVLAPHGARLAKRDGAVSLAQLAERGVAVEAVRAQLLDSLGLPMDLDAAARAFSIGALPRQPWVFPGIAR